MALLYIHQMNRVNSHNDLDQMINLDQTINIVIVIMPSPLIGGGIK